jgi:hypothetical protein
MTQAIDRTYYIALTFNDRTVKFASVCKLTAVIAWKGNFFLQDPDVGVTYYKQVSGEDLSNIEVSR